MQGALLARIKPVPYNVHPVYFVFPYLFPDRADRCISHYEVYLVLRAGNFLFADHRRHRPRMRHYRAVQSDARHLSERECAVGAARRFIAAALAESMQPDDLLSNLHASFPQARIRGERDADPWFCEIERKPAGVAAVRN